MRKVAIIIARGGSKRIPGKNIKSFRGKPIIAYSIQTAIQSNLFDYVMVSTDDDAIAKVALEYGAQVPFKRSAANSNDFAGTAEVILEVIEQLKTAGMEFGYACCIYPTAPFITKENLSEGFNIITQKKYDSVFPVCAFSYPIQRALKINDENRVEMMWPENVLKRSQDLETAYHDAGQFYWLDIPLFENAKKIFTSNTGAIVLNEMQVQDIDNDTDWKIAELKHSILFPGEY
jgi:pseudaminic acid cytidylyltransferase